MSQIITKKVYSRYFDKILSGDKTYELRLADWECSTGDILELIDIDDVTRQPTGRSLRKKVGTIVRTKDVDFWPQNDIEKYGFQIIGLLDEVKE
jgi:hypothetical protein